MGAHQIPSFSFLSPGSNPMVLPLPSLGRAIITFSIFLSMSMSAAIVAGIKLLAEPHTPKQMVKDVVLIASIYSFCRSFRSSRRFLPCWADSANFSFTTRPVAVFLAMRAFLIFSLFCLAKCTSPFPLYCPAPIRHHLLLQPHHFTFIQPMPFQDVVEHLILFL